MKVTTIQGKQYQCLEQAWDDYVNSTLAGKPMDADKYHGEVLAFIGGAISAMNVLSVAINKLDRKDISENQRMGLSIMKVLDNAVRMANEAQQNRKGNAN